MITSGSAEEVQKRLPESIRNFLGKYEVPLTISTDIRMQIKQFISGSQLVTSYRIDDDLDLFRQIVKIALLSFGVHYKKEDRPFYYLSYKVCNCYRDVTEAFLNPDPDNESGSRLVSSLCEPELLILYNPLASIKNKKTWELCQSIADSRKYEDRKTIFITFKPEPEMDGYLKPVDFSTPKRNSTNGQSKSNVDDIIEIPYD